MDAVLIVIIVSFVLVGGLIFVSGIFDFGGRRAKRSRKKASGSDATDKNADTARWRSVKIAPGLISCNYANILAGKVFLAREAPPLPLAKCDESDCRCKYIHMQDRRSGGDRRVQLGELTDYLPFNQTERRHLVSRRAADLAA